jgi:hypothetical protein
MCLSSLTLSPHEPASPATPILQHTLIPQVYIKQTLSAYGNAKRCYAFRQANLRRGLSSLDCAQSPNLADKHAIYSIVKLNIRVWAWYCMYNTSISRSVVRRCSARQQFILLSPIRLSHVYSLVMKLAVLSPSYPARGPVSPCTHLY